MKECFLCGRWCETERHHVFRGPNRTKSEHYGLVVDLCPECHRTGKRAVHQNREVMIRLCQWGQRKWMAEQGKTEQDFINEFGKNWL